MSEEYPRNSSKLYPDDKKWIDMMQGHFSEEDKRKVSFPETVHRVLNHYRQLCDEYNIRVETMEVLKNVKDIEEKQI